MIHSATHYSTSMPYRTAEFWKAFVSVLYGIIIAWPWIKDGWSKESKQREQDMKGPDGKWNWREIWEHRSLRIANGFYHSLIFMLLMTALFDKEFPFWLWLLIAGGVGGAAGYAAHLINLKEKYGK